MNYSEINFSSLCVCHWASSGLHFLWKDLTKFLAFCLMFSFHLIIVFLLKDSWCTTQPISQFVSSKHSLFFVGAFSSRHLLLLKMELICYLYLTSLVKGLLSFLCLSGVQNKYVLDVSLVIQLKSIFVQAKSQIPRQLKQISNVT